MEEGKPTVIEGIRKGIPTERTMAIVRAGAQASEHHRSVGVRMVHRRHFAVNGAEGVSTRGIGLQILTASDRLHTAQHNTQ